MSFGVFRLCPWPVGSAFDAPSVSPFRDGCRAGLVELEALDPTSSLAGYYLLPAARADFLRRLHCFFEERPAYEIAARLAPADGPEQRLLQRRLTELTTLREM